MRRAGGPGRLGRLGVVNLGDVPCAVPSTECHLNAVRVCLHEGVSRFSAAVPGYRWCGVASARTLSLMAFVNGCKEANRNKAETAHRCGYWHTFLNRDQVNPLCN
jgi:hypothetical protein